MSHTKDLIEEAFGKVHNYLESEYKKELDEMSGKDPLLPPHRSKINRIVEKFGFHGMRLQDFHKTAALGTSGMGRLSCTETMYEAIQNPDRFDRIYELLADEESKKTFDWFIKYRIADMPPKLIHSKGQPQKFLEDLKSIFIKEDS